MTMVFLFNRETILVALWHEISGYVYCCFYWTIFVALFKPWSIVHGLWTIK